MGQVGFHRGAIFSMDGKTFEIDRALPDDEFRLIERASSRYVYCTLNDLLLSYQNGDLRFLGQDSPTPRDADDQAGSRTMRKLLDEFPDARRETAFIKLAYVRCVHREHMHVHTPATLDPIIDDVWQKSGKPEKRPHWHTVKRWYDRWLASGRDARALVQRDDDKGNRERRYPAAVLDLVDQAVDEIYMRRERNTIEATLEHAQILVKRENTGLPSELHLPSPTRSLVKTSIQNVPAYDRAVARYGRDVANNKFRHVRGNIRVARILERVEIDHTDIDKIVLHDTTLMPLGRPYLTMAVEVFSRAVLGFYIGFEPPSYSTVAQCLKHAILPKIGLRDEFPELLNEWPCFGIPELIVVDNGQEFHSLSFESACQTMGMEIQYAGRKEGWGKPHIERLLRYVNHNCIHRIPGTTFSSVEERGDYDSLKNATLTLSELRGILVKWVVDYYHQRGHGTLEEPPARVWEKHFEPAAVPLMPSVSDLDVFLGAAQERSLSHKGILINNLQYSNPALGELRRRLGETMRVNVRYNPTDVGCIYVIDPVTGAPIQVNALNFDYANGLSLWTHKQCRAYAKEKLAGEDPDALLEARRVMQEMIDEAMRNKRRATRKRLARMEEGLSGRRPEKRKTPDSPPSLPAQARTTGPHRGLLSDTYVDTGSGVRTMKVSYDN